MKNFYLIFTFFLISLVSFGQINILSLNDTVCENQQTTLQVKAFIPGLGVVDQDQNYYESQIIGSNEWTIQNLNVQTYSNGDSIFNATSVAQWYGLGSGGASAAYVHINFDNTNDALYGKLYNFWAAKDPRNVCPVNWHVATNNEWDLMANYLGGANVAGDKLKDTILWQQPNTNSNESNFSAPPSGSYVLIPNTGNTQYTFSSFGSEADFWTSTQTSSTNMNLLGGNSRKLDTQTSNVYTNSFGWNRDGKAIRCVKDQINGGVNYLWDSGDTTQNLTISTDTSKWYYCTVTAYGQSFTDSIFITVIDPDVNITSNGPTTYCSGQNVTLFVNQNNNTTYQWQLNGLNINGADSSAYTTSSNSSADGAYTVIAESYGCSNISDTIVISTFEINDTINDVFCGSYTFNGQVYTNPGTYYQSFININGCDSILTLNLSYDTSSSTISQSACVSYSLNGQTYTSSGTYIQILTNAAGCDSTITLNLTINPNQFNPDFTVSSNLFTIPPFAAQFTNTTPNPSNYNFTWDFSDGTILQSNNPIVFHEYLYNGLYDVTLIAEDINTGCIDTIFYDDYIYCIGGTSCTHASTINQVGPISACLSDSVYLTCNADPNFTYQWRLNGTYILGAVDTIYYPTQTGTYSVLTLENGCPVESPAVSVSIGSTPQTPNIASSGAIIPCVGGSVTLSIPSTYNSYSWSSGGTSPTEIVSSSGTYFVTVSNSQGCETTSPVYTLNASFVTPPDVCIVGLAPLSNYNKVIWEKPISASVDSFYVYKETNQSNIYQKIGVTSYSDSAVFYDLSSNPSQQAYRYRLSLLDSCGVESSLGSMHKSIHLTINQGIGSTWNLIWSHYEGFTFSSYNIYRGTSATNMTLLTTIASSLNSYTDLTPPAGQLFYQIEVVSGYTCDPLKSTNNTSKSNIVDNAQIPTLILQKEISNINLFPNPTNNQIKINIKDYNGPVNIDVYDLNGRILDSTKSTTISLKKYARGTYIFKVRYGDIVEKVRVVKN